MRDKKNKGYRKLKVWEKAHNFAVEIYKISKSFPREELYGLTSQIRRASFSVPVNIVEGNASNSRKEFLNFLNIANRSLVETEYLLEILLEIEMLNKDNYLKLEELRSEVAVILISFIKGVKNKG
ncbi:MAG: four helix bundle protein [Candidatus Omnitrophica bacterium]|nr:four helix bundle protein [Candidatus Omnitrophota bacterium]